MGRYVTFKGTNKSLHAPAGLENEVGTLRVFNNGTTSISCWELSEEELAEIIATKHVYLSIMAGPSQPPCFVGSKTTVRECNEQYGNWDE